MIDLSGQKFGKLKVIARSFRQSNAGALWDCLCQCGNKVVANSLKLRRFTTISCGCHRRAACIKANTKHGMVNKSRTYRTWKEMRQRCLNPKSDKWRWYGGRGIKICDRWDLFENFLSDMGERPEGMTIDRIDNNGYYSPGNCRWTSHLNQTRKQSKNKLSTTIAADLRRDRFNGLSFRALGDKYGISPTTAMRCARGETWS